MTPVDCNKDMRAYHADEVTLSKPDQDEMRRRRNAGRTRLENGLADAGHPQYRCCVSQGSYAMRTMVQDSDCDYDIDDGVYFEATVLRRRDGSALTPLEARTRVKDALKDDRLAYDAVVKENCVRQPYPAGYHIDLPVYRIVRGFDILNRPVEHTELASRDRWVRQDARAVTRWFNQLVGQELKTGENDSSQIRRITKLTKKMARSGRGWKSSTTSGICITKLVADHMVPMTDREDDALRETWKAIKRALDRSLQIVHPVDAGNNLAEANDAQVGFFRDCLAYALKELEILDQADCTRTKALSAWDRVFHTTYFSDHANSGPHLSSLLRPAAASAGLSFPNRPVVPNSSSGFA